MILNSDISVGWNLLGLSHGVTVTTNRLCYCVRLRTVLIRKRTLKGYVYAQINLYDNGFN